MINAQPLPMATYSKKHYWHNKVDPMFDLYKHLAHEIIIEIDNEILEKIRAQSVKDGNK